MLLFAVTNCFIRPYGLYLFLDRGLWVGEQLCLWVDPRHHNEDVGGDYLILRKILESVLFDHLIALGSVIGESLNVGSAIGSSNRRFRGIFDCLWAHCIALEGPTKHRGGTPILSAAPSVVSPCSCLTVFVFLSTAFLIALWSP